MLHEIKALRLVEFQHPTPEMPRFPSVFYLLGLRQDVVVRQRSVTVRDVVLTVRLRCSGVVDDQQLLDVALHHDMVQKSLGLFFDIKSKPCCFPSVVVVRLKLFNKLFLLLCCSQSAPDLQS